jgi:signal transduction histidine kinase
MARDSGGGIAWRRTVTSRHAPTVAVGLLGLGAVVETLARGAGNGVFGLVVLLCLVGLATTVPLALPRPTAAAAVVIGAGGLSLAIFGILTVTGVAAQAVAAYRLGRRGLPAVAVTAGVPYLPVALTAPEHTGTRLIGVLLACLVPALVLAGIARRMRREDMANQAVRQAAAGTLIAHTARGERARIARELHDVVAHHISMVVVQAENARLTTPGMPAAGAARLSAIGDTARAALTEMRRLLGVLREDTPPDVAARQPQPGLRQLADLLDEARDASSAGTRLILRGRPATLDPGVELAAYRIVQEALTNARRHAPGAAVDVELHFTGAALRLCIRDNGPGPSDRPGAGGHGLLGMRERAAAVGGQLRTGLGSIGGFLVEATLPTSGTEPR